MNEDPTREYFVAFEDDGSFVDLVMSDQAGAYFRADHGWQSYQPTSRRLEGKTVIDVPERVTDFVDKNGSITQAQAQAQSERLTADADR